MTRGPPAWWRSGPVGQRFPLRSRRRMNACRAP
jgi:hypothetical protein